MITKQRWTFHVDAEVNSPVPITEWEALRHLTDLETGCLNRGETSVSFHLQPADDLKGPIVEYGVNAPNK